MLQLLLFEISLIGACRFLLRWHLNKTCIVDPILVLTDPTLVVLRMIALDKRMRAVIVLIRILHLKHIGLLGIHELCPLRQASDLYTRRLGHLLRQCSVQK